ncbi:MAG: glycosyltransferase, partial [Actinobacteria bacterium]|nr:glycosyltransferase [Actinomycetota bacterium]
RMQDGESLEHSSPREVDWVSGAFFMARREAIEEIGGFDEGYFMYGEDVDLCWRIHQAGYGVAYIPEAVVTHERAYSTKKHPYRMLIEHHRSTIRFASRRYGGFSFALLAAPMAILLAVRAAIALIQQVAEDLRAYFT